MNLNDAIEHVRRELPCDNNSAHDAFAVVVEAIPGKGPERKRCRIQWIDGDTGLPTPDSNPAVGEARCYSPDDHAWHESLPICVHHLATMPSNWDFRAYDGRSIAAHVGAVQFPSPLSECWEPTRLRDSAQRWNAWDDARAFADKHVKGWLSWRVETSQEDGAPVFLIALQPRGPWVRLSQ